MQVCSMLKGELTEAGKQQLRQPCARSKPASAAGRLVQLTPPVTHMQVESYVKNSETIGRGGAVKEIKLKFYALYKHVYTRNGQLDPAVIEPLIKGELPTSSAACAAMARDCESRVPSVEPPALSW